MFNTQHQKAHTAFRGRRFGSHSTLGGTRAIVVTAIGLVSLLAVVTVWGALAGAGSSSGAASEAASGAASGVASGAAQSAPVDANAAARGKTVFMSVCIACHGEHGEARPGLGKDLAHSEFLNGLSDQEVVAFLMQGRSPSDPLNTTGVQMPPKGGNPALSADDLKDVVAFLRTLRAN